MNTFEDIMEAATTKLVELAAKPIHPNELINTLRDEFGDGAALTAFTSALEDDLLRFGPSSRVLSAGQPSNAQDEEKTVSADESATDESGPAADALPIGQLLESLLGTLLGSPESAGTVSAGNKVRIKPGVSDDISSLRVGSVIDTFRDKALVIFTPNETDEGRMVVSDFENLIVIAR